jgi:hypothetical protein
MSDDRSSARSGIDELAPEEGLRLLRVFSAIARRSDRNDVVALIAQIADKLKTPTRN